MTTLVPSPPYKVPVLDPQGLMSQAWSKWFRDLFSRVGGVSSSSNSQLIALISNLQTRCDNLEGGLTKGPTL